jgi:hypothetical protein
MDIKVFCGDVETLKEQFLIEIFIPKTQEWKEFGVNKYENTLDSFLKFIEEYKEYYFVSYNGLRFDSIVVEYIVRNHDKWIDCSNLEICAKICQKAQDVIDDANYELFPEYREFELCLKQIDLMRVSHFDNKNRLVSLKRLEFELDLENIEEMPIHFLKEGLTIEEVNTVKSYCKSDVWATYQFWLVCIGETSHPMYKENNQIQLRMDIETEFGIKCMNFSNAKIGDEIIKKYYCETKGIEYRNLPKKGMFRKSIFLKNCVPKSIIFETNQLQLFLKEIKAKELKMNEDFEHTIEFYGQKYTFAKGGLHNVIDGKTYVSDENNDIVDIDVSGFYPASIINEAYYPYHLGKEFLVGYSKVYYKRIELKPLAKKDKRIKGIVLGLKEAGNCPYGKSSDMQSWLYDKQMTLSVCITGELSLLMLIEKCELSGIKCIMANTDGCSFIVPKNKYEIFTNIKKKWLEKISNRLSYETEEVKYEKMVFSNVNSYLAIKANDTSEDRVKLKGEFLKDCELHKNKSNRIIAIALEKWYVDGINIEETIRNHKNIYDFSARAKSSKDFHYEGISSKGTNIYRKLIRYYISNEGEKLLKIKNPECLTNAAPVSQVNAGEWLATVCNFLPKTTKIEDCNLNYSFYIQKTQEILDKIKLEGKKAAKKQPINQTSLW